MSVQRSAHVAGVGPRHDKHGGKHVYKQIDLGQESIPLYKLTDKEACKHVCKLTIMYLTRQIGRHHGESGPQPSAGYRTRELGRRTDRGQRKPNRKPNHASVTPRHNDHRSSAAVG
jgi:hypothetical protein